MINKLHYRSDIDGLRAIAVLTVVLFHYDFPLLSGGFVGVDVFFVISGYLITSILWQQNSADEFSFIGFYDRRIRRILPTLLCVIAFSFVGGWLFLLPMDFKSLGLQAITVALGISNFYFYFNTGYFHQSSDLLPLLHTWSLAVEEQFYLIWPLVLNFVSRFTKNSTRGVVATIGIVIVTSFVSSIWVVETNNNLAFYMFFNRAWELALGAILVFAPKLSSRISSEALPLTGVFLILISSIYLSAESLFPGWNAVLPCAGAALIIWPQKHAGFTGKLLSSKPLVFVGLISYSFYLWHWPVLVFSNTIV